MTWPTWVLDEKDEKIKDLEKQILELEGMLRDANLIIAKEARSELAMPFLKRSEGALSK